jgi:hypothetical protein
MSTAWWQGLYYQESKVDVAGIKDAGDSVQTWMFALRGLNEPPYGLLVDLEQLADGMFPSRYLTAEDNPSVKIESGPDLPKRIRLAYAINAFVTQTNADLITPQAQPTLRAYTCE